MLFSGLLAERKGGRMKQVVIVLVAVAAFASVGCKDKSPQGMPPQSAKSGSETQVTAAQSGTASENNPHADLPPQAPATSARQAHKGKVVSTANAAGYTSIEVEENGKKLWAAVMETKVKAGDDVEFPDVPPMKNFHSNSLNRTFERIIFAPAILVNGKPGNV
jgi:hypothetical protein